MLAASIERMKSERSRSSGTRRDDDDDEEDGDHHGGEPGHGHGVDEETVDAGDQRPGGTCGKGQRDEDRRRRRRLGGVRRPLEEEAEREDHQGRLDDHSEGESHPLHALTAVTRTAR
jgi:hypothetical protein